MTELTVADIGGTHARFAIARIDGGRVLEVGVIVTLKTGDYPDLAGAWRAYAQTIGRDLPREASIAVAGAVSGEVLQLTNNPWTLRPGDFPAQLGLERFVLLNDFGAIANAAGQLDRDSFVSICGPDVDLPREGVVSILGPGTGFGVAQLLRRADGDIIIETEGGHIDFAPIDAVDDALLQRLRAAHGRVSVERVVAGPGLRGIYGTLAAAAGGPAAACDDKTLWTQALDGADPVAAQALERFCMNLGTVCGDIALAQGASAVVIAGGVGRRIAEVLARSGFAARFAAKGRFKARMDAIPVKLIVHPEPGLFGAAAAFARAHPV
jgi:glucokinase